MNQVKKTRSRFLILLSLFLAAAANAGNILMIVDEEGMNAGDSAVKVLAEELGHTVTIATPPTTPSQADTMNLVLFSSSYHGDWDDGFRTMNIPVLSWDWYGYEIMAMAESGTLTSAPGESTVTIIDSTHIMAAGLTGTVQVDTCCSELDFAEPPSSAQIVATRTCSPWVSSIWGFEAGAGMAYGFPAPARRVGTFIYENGPTLLTPEGKALIKAEITWAISPPDTGTSSSPVVEITSPLDGAIIHESSTSVAWTVDDVNQTSMLTESLTVGSNNIIRSATNSFGTTYDTITVTRSTDPPVVVISYPTQSLELFSTPVPVDWTIDGVTQSSGNSESLSEGLNTITRQCIYNGGTQSVSASVKVYLDTQPETCLGP